MSKRHGTNAYIDEKVFRRTAVRTKKINLSPVVMRGGIRL